MTAIDTVVETIARVARDEDADLIPMSTHALTGPRRALPGGAHRGRSGR